MKPIRYGDDDTSPNRLLRTFGNRCYMADIDCVQYEFLPDRSTRLVCIIDWKHFNTKCISYDPAKSHDAYSLWVQRDLANREGVPFFIGICYTKPEDGYGEGKQHPAMLCLVPGNKLALKAMNGKTWYTPKELAHLMMSLRKTPPPTPNTSHLQDIFIKYPLSTSVDIESIKASF
jgi:hypothetical protein